MSRPAKSLRVLIVDDDDVDRMAVRRALSKGGFDVDVTEAVDFDSARGAILKSTLDCVLLDFNCPAATGSSSSASQKMREIDAPIIMLTGQGDEALAVDLMHNGAADYLPKSQLSADRLSQSIRRALRVRDAERRAREAHAAVERQAAELRALAETSVRIHAALSIEEAIDIVARDAHAIFEARIVLLLLRGVDGGTPLARLSLSDVEVRGVINAIAAKASEALLFDWGRSLHLTEAALAKNAEWIALIRLSSDPPVTLPGSSPPD